MTKKDLIAKIAEDIDFRKADVEKALDSLGSVAAAELLGGGEVPFPGLGKLVVVETKAKRGRNPKTGAAIDIPAGRKTKFKAGRELAEALKS